MISENKIRLRAKKLADTSDDYAWQTNPELAKLDAVQPLGINFARYLASYARELRFPSSVRRTFAIETQDGKHIGNCVYYGIDEISGEAELGIMIGNRDYWDRGYGTDAVTALVNHIFNETELNRVYLKTLYDNHRAQQCFKKGGFVPYEETVRNGYRFVLMEINRGQWQEKQAKA